MVFFAATLELRFASGRDGDRALIRGRGETRGRCFDLAAVVVLFLPPSFRREDFRWSFRVDLGGGEGDGEACTCTDTAGPGMKGKRKAAPAVAVGEKYPTVSAMKQSVGVRKLWLIQHQQQRMCPEIG
jgi:hypothetical protein